MSARLHCGADDGLRPAGHFLRGPSAERQQEHPGRVHTVEHEMGRPMRQGLGLARASAGDDQQRAGAYAALSQRAAMGGSGPLRRIQGVSRV